MSLSHHRHYTGSLRGIILDWAGTTMDYGCYAPAVVFIEVFKRQGVDISIEQAREPMGVHKKTHIYQITQNTDVRIKWKEVHGQFPDETDVERMFKQFVPLQMDCLENYAELIPGCLKAVTDFRKRGLKIGSTTGYLPEMMVLLAKEAEKQGYKPDSTVCAGDVPEGRPAPWMCLRNAEHLQIYPMEALVKVGDTLPDIQEGLNAGMWTIGLAMTGNEIGLNEAEINALSPEELQHKKNQAYHRMNQAGAHYIVDGIWDVLPLLDKIDARLAKGEKP